MNVLFLINDLNVGGAERVTVELTRLLVRHGVRAELLAMVDRGPLRAQLDPAVPYRAVLPDGHPAAARARYQLARVVAPVAAAARHFDVVVATCPFTATVARLGQPWHRRPVLGWVHFNYAGFMPYVTGWMAHATRLVYPRLQRVVYVAEGAREAMLTHLPVPPQRTEVIYNPLNPQTLTAGESTTLPAVRAFRATHPGLPCLVSVGRLARVKRLDRLLRVHAQLIYGGTPCVLVLVGDGEERAALQELAATLGTESKVLFAGADPYPLAVLRQADAFVMTSDTEALPTAMLEAMYAGALVAALDCPTGPREILLGGRCGLLAPAGAERMLVGMLARALSVPEESTGLRAAAHQRVQDFLPEAVVPRWLQLLRRVCTPALR